MFLLLFKPAKIADEKWQASNTKLCLRYECESNNEKRQNRISCRRIDKLWKEGQKKQRYLRVQNICNDAVSVYRKVVAFVVLR